MMNNYRHATLNTASFRGLVLVGVILALAACGKQTSIGKAPTPTTTPTLTASPTVSGTLPTPAPVGGIPTATQSWGDHAASVTISTALDSTHEFTPEVIARDGGSICGLDLAYDGQGMPTSGQIGILTVATRQFQAMPYPDAQNIPGYPPECVATDGRYFVLSDSDSPGTTGGVFHVRYWSYDTQTGQLHIVATAHALGMLQGDAVDHGLLTIGAESPQGDASALDVIDLGTGATHAVKTATGANVSFYALALAWPYLVYGTSSPAVSPVDAYNTLNLQTNGQTTLPSDISSSMAITGDTLFAAGQSASQIDEIDHIGLPGVHPLPLFTYPDNGQMSAANARLILFVSGAFPLVWDRREQHLVLLANATDLLQQRAYPVQMSGDFLMVTTQSGNHGQVTIYDTATLPAQ